MPLGTATITYDLADMLGVDFDARRTKVWVTTNVPSETVVDTGANKIRLGSGNGSIADDGTGSVDVWTPGTGSNPASWQTYVHVAYPDRNTPRGRAQRTFGPFTITTSADLADLIDEQEIPPVYPTAVGTALGAFVSSAQAAATTASASATSAAASASAAQSIVLADAEGAVDALLANPASAPSARLSAAYVPKWKASTAYAAGDKVMAPDGSIVEALAAFTSGATYSAANWKAASGLAAQIATKVGAEAADQASPLRVSLYNEWFARDDALAMNGRDLADVGDSFGQVLSGITPFPNLINTKRGGALANFSVSGSFWRDVTARAINGVTPGIAADNFVIAHSGINPAYFQGIGNAISRQAERDAFEMLLWILASSTKIENTAWTETGAGWGPYTHTKLSGGSGRITSADGNYAEIAPAAGDYVGMGFTFRAGDPSGGHQLGIASETGTWAKDGAAVNTFTKDAPWWSNLESQDNASEFGPSAGNLAPRPIRLFGLTGANVIRQTRTAASGAGYTIRDAMWKLSQTPPWIVVLKPTYPSSSWQSASTNAAYGVTAGASKANVDAYRRDIDSVVASVTAAYAPLRGKIVVVDPVASGWDAAIHASNPSDGLHPNATGHAFLASLIQREVAFAVRMRRQLIATGQITVA